MLRGAVQPKLLRRHVLQAGLAAAAGPLLPRCSLFAFRGSTPPPFPADLPQTTPWPEANAILASTVAPVFPAATYPAPRVADR